ncbi:TBC1 domain family member 7 [Ixodes scapularis]
MEGCFGCFNKNGVLPTFEENASVFEKDQTDQYNALKRSLLVMRVVNDDTRPPEVVVLMYLLGEGQLHLDIEQQMQDEEAQHLLGIASAFFKMDLSEQDVYWMTRNFWRQLKKLSIDSCLMSKQMEDTLEKEDAELFQHLLRIKAFPVLPVDVWFRRCFAEVLDEDALVRVWDKVIGGSVKFLPQVGAVLLMSLRTSLLQLRGVGDVLELLSKVPKDASDVVVNKVLE